MRITLKEKLTLDGFFLSHFPEGLHVKIVPQKA